MIHTVSMVFEQIWKNLTRIWTLHADFSFQDANHLHIPINYLAITGLGQLILACKILYPKEIEVSWAYHTWLISWDPVSKFFKSCEEERRKRKKGKFYKIKSKTYI